MRTSQLPKAIRMALLAGAAVALPASPAFAQDEDGSAELDRIEVTGSRIKRVDVEGPNPITIIDRDDLEVTGEVSVAEVLRQSTFNSFGSLAPASGSTAQSQSTVSLRGVGSQRTLILLDGRRIAGSPVLGGASQNLNTIPFAAVERIEILRDGASAIYGSDAIGGVINIVLRKDYEGLTVTAQASRPTRGEPDENSGSVTGGITGSRGNMTFAIDHQERDIFFNVDRPTGIPGLDPAVGLSAFGFPATAALYDSADGSLSGDFLGFAADPRCPSALGSDPLFPNSVLNTASGFCQFNYAATNAAEASLRRDSLMVTGNFDISDRTSAFTRITAVSGSSFGRYAATPFTSTPTMAGSNPNNIFGQDLALFFRFVPGGTRDDTVRDHQLDVVLGLEGSLDFFGGAEWEIGMQHNRYEVDRVGQGYALLPPLQGLIDSGTLNPFADPRDPAFQSAVGLVRHTILQTSESRFVGIDGQLSFDLMQLPAGALQLATGFEYRDEFFKDLTDDQSAAGNVAGTSGGNARGERAAGAIFAEALIPVIDGLNISLALRHDRYNDFGNDTNPKLSIEYRPIDTLLVRGSVGTGFRAPSLQELYRAPAQNFTSGIDTLACEQGITGLPFDPCEANQYEASVRGNPNLEAEESTSWGAGFVWNPIDDLAISLDYYNIELGQQIANLPFQTVLDLEAEGNPLVAGLVRRNPGTGGLTGGLVILPALNLSGFKTNGWDLNFDYTIDTAIGRWNPFLDVSYVGRFDQETVPGTGFDTLLTVGAPDLRANLGVNWSHGDFGASLIANHIGDNEGQVGNQTSQVSSWTTLDAQVSWATPWKGKVTLGVRNLADRDPPLNNVIFQHPFYVNSQYDFLGRVPYVRYTQDL